MAIKDKFLNFITLLTESRYLAAIRRGFISIMPLMIAVSFAVLINNFPLPQYQDFMNNLLGEDWKNFGTAIWAGTFAVISLSACFSISSHLTTWYNDNKNTEINPIISSLIAVACFLTFSYNVGGTYIPYEIIGATGLFVAIISSLVSTELFILFSKSKKISLRYYSTDPEETIPQAFRAIGPGLITLAIFALLRMGIFLLGFDDPNEIIYLILQKPFESLSNNPLTATIFNTTTHFLWIFGIHGNNVLENVAQNVFETAMDSNILAASMGTEIPYMYTKTFFDAFVYMGGSGTTLCLILAILIFGKKSHYLKLSKISLGPGLFNINEPLLYGMPIVLNPIFILPFLLTPLVMMATTSLAMKIGIVPYTIARVEWTTPVLYSGYIATGGSIAAIFLQVFNMIIGTFVYYPFLKIATNLQEKRFEKSFEQLEQIAQEEFNAYGVKKLTERNDDVGAVARQLSNDLALAISDGYLQAVYQPQINLTESRVFGVEALLRWKHPVHGYISPTAAVALAEESDLINDIGLWMIKETCKEIKKWEKNDVKDITFSVNVSTVQLEDENFADQVIAIVAKNKVSPHLIELEITESLALSNNKSIRNNLNKINEEGICLAIDDFGMGHSSLVYLKMFPVNVLKIDRVLTQNVDKEKQNLEIIQAIASLCESVDIRMIAEYAERYEQIELLNSIGCENFQGYYFSRPLKAEDCFNYIKIFNNMIK